MSLGACRRRRHKIVIKRANPNESLGLLCKCFSRIPVHEASTTGVRDYGNLRIMHAFAVPISVYCLIRENAAPSKRGSLHNRLLTCRSSHRPEPYRVYFAAAAIRDQSAICIRATSVYLPFSGRKIEASPSFTSNQSLPSASTMFGLWVIRTVFVPGSGTTASILRKAPARRLFSFGDTTRPPSVRSAVFSIFLKPASTAV